jgi:hypothetical protein
MPVAVPVTSPTLPSKIIGRSFTRQYVQSIAALCAAGCVWGVLEDHVADAGD